MQDISIYIAWKTDETQALMQQNKAGMSASAFYKIIEQEPPSGVPLHHRVGLRPHVHNKRSSDDLVPSFATQRAKDYYNMVQELKKKERKRNQKKRS